MNPMNPIKFKKAIYACCIYANEKLMKNQSCSCFGATRQMKECQRSLFNINRFPMQYKVCLTIKYDYCSRLNVLNQYSYHEITVKKKRTNKKLNKCHRSGSNEYMYIPCLNTPRVSVSVCVLNKNNNLRQNSNCNKINTKRERLMKNAIKMCNIRMLLTKVYVHIFLNMEHGYTSCVTQHTHTQTHAPNEFFCYS